MFSLRKAVRLIVALCLFHVAAATHTQGGIPQPLPNMPSSSELAALKAIYEAFNLAPYKSASAYLTGWTFTKNKLGHYSNPCNPTNQWFGVTCSTSPKNPKLTYVTALSFSGLGLVGTLSPAISSLSNIQQIDFSSNRISGKIPNLEKLKSLRFLNLEFNYFTGPCPVALPKTLQRLELWANSLTGTLPSAIAALSNLQTLDIADNEIEGTIPAWLTTMQNLEVVNLFTNSLTGSLPVKIGKLTNLIALDVSLNQLTGTVPPALLRIASLEMLGFNENVFTGPLLNYGLIPGLKTLDLSGNRFTGQIPSGFANLRLVTFLDVSRNKLTGR